MAYSFKNLIKGASLYSLANVGAKLIALLAIPVYTRLLSPSEYGILGIVEMAIAILTGVYMLGLDNAQVRKLYETESPSTTPSFILTINTYFWSIPLGMTLLLAWKAVPYFTAHFFNEGYEDATKICLFGMAAAFMALCRLITTHFHTAKKNYKAASTLFLLHPLLTASIGVYLMLNHNMGPLGKVIGLCSAEFVILLFFYIPYLKNNAGRPFSKSQFMYGFTYGYPIMFHLLGNILLTSIDRAVIKHYLPFSEVGLYTLGYQLGMVVIVFTHGFNKAWTPNYYDMLTNDRSAAGKQIQKVIALWMSGVGLICLVGALLSRELTHLLAPPSHHGAAPVVPIVIMSYLFNGLYMFVVSTVFYFKKTKVLPLITLSISAVNIGLNILVIPKYGIIGAAYTTLICYMLMAISFYVYSRRLHNPHYPLIRISICVSLCSLSLLPFHELPTVSSWLFRILLVIIYTMTCLILFRKELTPILQKAIALTRTTFSK